MADLVFRAEPEPDAAPNWLMSPYAMPAILSATGGLVIALLEVAGWLGCTCLLLCGAALSATVGLAIGTPPRDAHNGTPRQS